MAQAELRTILASADFRSLLYTRLVGQFGDGLLQAGLATFVLFSPERQSTPGQVAAAFAILLLPYSLIGPFAGILLDRWRRRNVLVRANWLRALVMVPVTALVAGGEDGLTLGVTVLITIGIGRFILSGLSASLPHVVAPGSLVTANSLKPTAGTIAFAIGAFAGVVLRNLAGGGDGGATVVMIATLLVYCLAGVFPLRLAPGRLGPDDGQHRTVIDVAGDLGASLREVAHVPPAWRAMTVLMVNRVIVGALTVILLLILRQHVHPPDDPDAALGDFAIVAVGLTAGAFLSALITPHFARRLGAVRWSSLLMVLAAVVITPGLFSLSVPIMIACAPFVGLTNQGAKICCDTILQRQLPDEHLGRVFSMVDVGVNVGTVLGVTVVALTAPPDGISAAGFLAVGATYLACAAWYLAADRRGAGRQGAASLLP